MMTLELGPAARDRLRLLCLGAHPDDIEIGCGGTVLRLLAERPGGSVDWIVFSGSEPRAAEARRGAALFLGDAAEARVSVHRFRDGFFPYLGGEIKELFESLKATLAPDVIFTHHAHDLHQDHRVIAELTWNTFRDQLILEYEIPKYDGGLATPNVFVPLDEATRRRKVGSLMEAFATQREKRWFTDATFDGLMRLRGVECASPSGYAEGFHARKLVVA
ncbi:MAG TPA: PIG-L deacetylase family protein [Longimicrobiales bacterium]|nr:PIG-L deacetylase family protein [Longimicrobiales bacterium]